MSGCLRKNYIYSIIKTFIRKNTLYSIFLYSEVETREKCATCHSLTRCLYAFRMSCNVACLDTPNILYGSPRESPATTDGVSWRTAKRISSRNACFINGTTPATRGTLPWVGRSPVIKRSIDIINRDADTVNTVGFPPACDTVRAASLIDTGARHRLPFHFRLPLALSPRSGSADIFLARRPVVHPSSTRMRSVVTPSAGEPPHINTPRATAATMLRRSGRAYRGICCYIVWDVGPPSPDTRCHYRAENVGGEFSCSESITTFFSCSVSARASACRSNSTMTTSCPIDAVPVRSWCTTFLNTIFHFTRMVL